jgi:hypothetical protein
VVDEREAVEQRDALPFDQVTRGLLVGFPVVNRWMKVEKWGQRKRFGDNPGDLALSY